MLFVAASPAAAVQAVTVADPTGLWMNPTHSVEVATGPCGTALCGRVAWSSHEAASDAQAAGSRPLNGTTILEDFHRAGGATWHGRVLVPDMGRSFESTIRLVDSNRITVSGCMLGGLICKSQTWTRVGS